MRRLWRPTMTLVRIPPQPLQHPSGRRLLRSRSRGVVAEDVNPADAMPQVPQGVGIEYEIDDEDDEESTTRSKRKESIATYVKAALEPAWGHGLRRVCRPEPEALERIQSLARLLSGRQAKLHAARVMGTPTGRKRRRDTTTHHKKADDVDTLDDEVEGDEEEEEEEEEEKPWDAEDKVGPMLVHRRKGEWGLMKNWNPVSQPVIDCDKGGTKSTTLLRRCACLLVCAPPPAKERYSPGEALAYLSRTVISNYSITQRVLSEAFRSPGQQQHHHRGAMAPRSVLDFGCGPGTGLLAAHALWPNDIERLEGVDRSEEMLDLSRLVLQGVEAHKLVLHRQLPALASQVSRTGQLYDLVLSTYTLAELPSEAAMAAAAQLLWGMVAPQGALVLIEPGSPLGSHVVRSVRKMILDEGAKGKYEAYTVAPCPHDHPCPLRSDEWCSFQQRVQSPALLSPGGKGSAKNFRDVAFSYVILRKSPPPTQGPEAWSRYSSLHALRYKIDGAGGGDDGDDLERQLKENWDALEKEEDEGGEGSGLLRGEWARLIRSPKKAKGRVTMELCTPEGHIENVTVARAASNRTLPGKLLAARRADWGGLWPYPEL